VRISDNFFLFYNCDAIKFKLRSSQQSKDKNRKTGIFMKKKLDKLIPPFLWKYKQTHFAGLKSARCYMKFSHPG